MTNEDGFYYVLCALVAVAFLLWLSGCAATPEIPSIQPTLALVRGCKAVNHFQSNNTDTINSTVRSAGGNAKVVFPAERRGYTEVTGYACP